MKKKIILMLVLAIVLSFSIVGYAIEGPEMVTVSAGTAPDGNKSIDYDIEMGKYEVTFEEYIVFCNDTGKSIPDDEGWGKGTRPVINVSWYDAVEYCNWLSKQEGLNPAYDTSGSKNTWSLKDYPQNLEGYRLPTSNEWEYVAHGGVNGNNTKYAGSDNIDEVAWYNFNSGMETHPVGKKKPNELGIYDMSGNVSEWTNTSDGSNYRVTRGGSFYDFAEDFELSSYYSQTMSSCYDFLGFRLTKSKTD